VNDERALRIEPGFSPNLIGGWSGNFVTTGVFGGTIGGGGCPTSCFGAVFPNLVTDHLGTVAGGANNTAGDGTGTVGDRCCAFVGGGFSNIASGSFATVGGGVSNTASGSLATVGGGDVNTASGFLATVPGGEQTTAAGDYSLAAGRRAKIDAAHDGAFLFADSTFADFNSVAANEFAVRASGGFRFRTSSNLSTGCNLAAGSGTFACTSDRSVKTAFAPVDPRGVLQAVTEVPISTWAFREDPSARHIGPMAQDFHRAFGLGSDERTIATVDADGVALAAIQGLHLMVEERNAQLEARLAAVETRASSPSAGFPAIGWWGLAAAIGVLGFGLGRRSGAMISS
jgi:hypothetical protein